MPLRNFFQKYDRLVLFDTETTGLAYSRDEIIEFAAVVVELVDGKPTITTEYDELVQLAPGSLIPPKIQQLTGISNDDVAARGLPKAQVCRDMADLFRGNALLIAFNAHFDLSFLYYMLLRDGDPTILKGKDKLDLLTAFRDRRVPPNRLANAIDAYNLTGKVVNSHRAVDDVIATVAVMEEMAKEKDDLLHYINLFGYHPIYGLEGKPIGSVTYKPHATDLKTPLYLK